MFRIILASLFAIGLLASGCKSHEPHHPHRHHEDCHRAGHRGVGHPGTIHHHHSHGRRDVPPTPPKNAR